MAESAEGFEVFVAVVESGSISAAARARDEPRETVSRQLAGEWVAAEAVAAAWAVTSRARRRIRFVPVGCRPARCRALSRAC